MPELDLDAARAEHGRLVRVDLRGREYVFAPLDLAEAQALAERLDRTPELALPQAIAACRLCCLTSLDEFDEAAENFPLAFSAERGVCSKLLSLASEDLAAQVKEAIARWRQGERQLGSMAEDLLAFKAYQGGHAGPRETAGALHIAELIDTTKALYKLHLAFMKSMGKRRG